MRILLLWLALSFAGTSQAAARERHERDTVRDAATLPDRHADALLSDAHDIYRICAPRQQRLVPGQGQKPGKQGLTRTPTQANCHHRANRLHAGCSLASAPARACAPRDYYVFALRRILC